MNLQSQKLLFVGGFSGVAKESKKPFYALNLAKASTRDSCFGFDAFTVFVDEVTFNDFKSKYPDGCNWFLGTLVYVKGSNVLISYDLE